MTKISQLVSFARLRGAMEEGQCSPSTHTAAADVSSPEPLRHSSRVGMAPPALSVRRRQARPRHRLGSTPSNRVRKGGVDRLRPTANRPAVALYERAISAVPTAPAFHRPLSDPTLLTLLRNVARDLGYVVL